MIEEMKSAQDSQEFTGSGAQALTGRGAGFQGSTQNGAFEHRPRSHSAFEQLVINGIEKRFAYSLIRTTSFELGPERAGSPDEVMDQLALEIMKTTRVASPFVSVKAASENEPEKRKAPTIIALVGPTGVG